MPLFRLRYGKTGVLVTLILMFSLVIFVSSLFWLAIQGPWSESFENTVFKSSPSRQQKQIEMLNIRYNEYNFTHAVEDLKNAGCTVEESTENYPDWTTHLEYTLFRKEAIKQKRVLIVEKRPETYVLIVISSGKAYEWSPERPI